MQAWWVGGLAVPAVILKNLANARKKQVKEEDIVEARFVAYLCVLQSFDIL